MPRIKSRNLVLIVSLGLNAVTLLASALWVHRHGGTRYLLEGLGVVPMRFTPLPWQVDKIAEFRRLPNTPNEIVFAGDSIVNSGPWHEFFSPIRNRGMGGDTTAGLIQRLDEITESKPDKLFIQIGTNDLSRNLDVDQIVTNYGMILDRVRGASPRTRVYVISVLPINTTLLKSALTIQKKDRIPELNRRLAELASARGHTYVDLYSHFVDADGELDRKYGDAGGGHLSFDGYLLYARIIAPYVESGSRAVATK